MLIKHYWPFFMMHTAVKMCWASTAVTPEMPRLNQATTPVVYKVTPAWTYSRGCERTSRALWTWVSRSCELRKQCSSYINTNQVILQSLCCINIIWDMQCAFFFCAPQALPSCKMWDVSFQCVMMSGPWMIQLFSVTVHLREPVMFFVALWRLTFLL